jgi:hypothetical protein
MSSSFPIIGIVAIVVVAVVLCVICYYALKQRQESNNRRFGANYVISVPQNSSIPQNYLAQHYINTDDTLYSITVQERERAYKDEKDRRQKEDQEVAKKQKEAAEQKYRQQCYNAAIASSSHCDFYYDSSTGKYV